jgi:hypothetical protein
MVVDAGDNVCTEPVKLPGIQLYVEAPFAVNVAELPEQIVAEFTVTVGDGVTKTV